MSLLSINNKTELFYNGYFYDVSEYQIVEYSDRFAITANHGLVDLESGASLKLSRGARKLSASNKYLCIVDTANNLKIFNSQTLKELYSQPIDDRSTITVSDEKVYLNESGIFYAYDPQTSSMEKDLRLNGDILTSCAGYIIYRFGNCLVGTNEDFTSVNYEDDNEDHPIWLKGFDIGSIKYDDFNFQDEYTLHLLSGNKIYSVKFDGEIKSYNLGEGDVKMIK